VFYVLKEAFNVAVIISANTEVIISVCNKRSVLHFSSRRVSICKARARHLSS